MTENPYPVKSQRPQIQSQDVNPILMMFDPVIADRVAQVAKTMAMGRVTVPEHLRGNLGDCLAIVMQSASWRLNPFLVAQKTMIVQGKLSYEAQLISAVVSSLGVLDGRFSFEYVGDWRRLAKRPKILKSKHGKDIPVPGWREQDEDGLSLIVSGKLKGDPAVKTHELFLASVWPRNSPLWATAPRQQATYLATKQWVRLYAPDAILGVYTPDELEQQTEQVVTGERVDAPSTAAENIMDLAREAGRNKTVQTQQEQQNEPETKAETEEKPVSTAPEWPKEHEGKLVDIRGIPWNEEIHSGAKSCTHDGIWRRRRGVSAKRIAEIEEPSQDEPEKEPEQQEESEPEMLSEAWFNLGISQSGDLQDLTEYEQLLVENEGEMDAEVFNGLRGKIAHRRAELGNEDENRSES